VVVRSELQPDSMKKPTKHARCWWCNKQLVPGHSAYVTSDTGQRLKVHKSCEDKAGSFWKKITAAVNNPIYATRSG
jgi:RNase P subunit RPR2